MKRKYANYFDYSNKPIKELGIVKDWLRLVNGMYHSAQYGPNPNYAPDCIVLDNKKEKVAIEVCELVDRVAIEENLRGNSIYRVYTEDSFQHSITEILRNKDAKEYHGKYSKIVALIHTDEPYLSYDTCKPWLENYRPSFSPKQINEAYLIFSHDPLLKGISCLKINV